MTHTKFNSYKGHGKHDAVLFLPSDPFSSLSNLLTIHTNIHAGCDRTGWQPWLGILVVEWPGRYDGEKGESGTRKTDVEGEFDVLREEADKEGKYLMLLDRDNSET